jgi:electron transfer flavoprotein alpha subunit
LSLEIVSSETAHGRVNLTGAQVIVSGGRGLRSRGDYEQMLGDLAGALQRRLGAGVEKGASRAAVEQGYAERMRQVGQTGTSVAPRIYLALGISGAIQHMIGIANAETIFAVNSDPHAPIFKSCDYFMVGKVEEIMPQLVRSLGEGI